jgi:hypothetical protein
MANFTDVFALIRVLEVMIQQVQPESAKQELQQYLSELNAMIKQIQQDQLNGAEVAEVVKGLSKAADLVNWLDAILELLV